LLTIAAIVAIMAIVNSVMPALSRANNSMVMTGDAINDRISSQIDIIHATGVDTATQADTWVKNVGASRIGPIDYSDVFFGPENDFIRVPYGGPSCAAPCWEYALEGGATEWEPTATLHITVHLDYSLAAGTTYFVKVVAPNGISDAKFFSV
jgi:flagellar protein FlaG